MVDPTMPQNLKFSHKILLAATLVVIVAFTLFSVYNDTRQSASIRADLENRLQLASYAAAGNIENWLSGRILLTENMAQSLELAIAEGADLQGVISRPVLAKAFLSTYLGQASDGRFLANPPAQMAADYDPRKRPWYQDTARADRTMLIPPYLDQITNSLVVSVLVPVHAGSSLYGVTGGDISLETLTKIINSIDLGGLGHAFLVSEDGTVLVHPQGELVMKNLRDLFPDAGIALTGKLAEVAQNGEERLLTFAPVSGLPDVKWYVGLSVDKDKAYAELDAFRLSATIATLIAVLSIVALLGLLIRVLMQPLQAMSRAMQDIAEGEGDLTMRLTIHSRDEFGELAGAFNRFVERIHASIREVSSATYQLNEVAKLVVNASNSSMANSDEQSNRTNSVAAAINELGAAAQEIARNAADASHQASDARRQAEDGRQVVQRTIAAMNELSAKISASCANIEALNSKTVNIGQILEVIKGISEQTNLLALNAAIEAARAGDMGRGFAVVADEVRSLAQRTAESTEQIHQLIAKLQRTAEEAVLTMEIGRKQADEGVERVQKADQALHGISEAVANITDMANQIAAAAEEQSSVADEISRNITTIAQLADQTATEAQNTTELSRALTATAHSQSALVERFNR